MARPIKSGLDYFPFDTDTSSDQKIEFIEAKHGLIGYAVYTKLLERLYKEGYYLKWTDKYALIFAKKLGIELETLKEIVVDLLEEELFDNDLYERTSVLSSKAIQERYIKACQKRRVILFDEKCLLLPIDKINELVSKDQKIEVSGPQTIAEAGVCGPQTIAEHGVCSPFSTQRKVKETKGKEREHTPPTPSSGQTDPEGSCVNACSDDLVLDVEEDPVEKMPRGGHEPDPMSFRPKVRNKLKESILKGQSKRLFDSIWDQWEPTLRGTYFDATTSFQAHVALTDQNELEAVKLAFDAYRKTDQVKRNIIMKPETWFAQWKNFIPKAHAPP